MQKFDEILASDKIMLTTQEVGRAIGISPERITAQARKDPSMLGFPVVVACDTVRIPREAFLAWISGGVRYGFYQPVAPEVFDGNEPGRLVVVPD